MKRSSRSSALSILFILAIITIGAVLWNMGEPSPIDQSVEQQQTTPGQSNKAAAAFNKSERSLDDPASPWVIVNKQRPLNPADYVPDLVIPSVGLRLPSSNPEMQVSKQAAPALEDMFAAAKKDGIDMIVASAYRSYSLQVSVYGAEVKNNGQQQADRESARPGHSEHQTGLAIDVGVPSRDCEVEQCFADLPAGKWVAANAYKYGFVLHYGKNQESVTGYTYEPWHLRYVGIDLSTEIHSQNNPPLETFFNLGPAANYR